MSQFWKIIDRFGDGDRVCGVLSVITGVCLTILILFFIEVIGEFVKKYHGDIETTISIVLLIGVACFVAGWTLYALSVLLCGALRGLRWLYIRFLSR